MIIIPIRKGGHGTRGILFRMSCAIVLWERMLLMRYVL